MAAMAATAGDGEWLVGIKCAVGEASPWYMYFSCDRKSMMGDINTASDNGGGDENLGELECWTDVRDCGPGTGGGV